MVDYENRETIEATMGRFFNASELATGPIPELYALGAEFHAANEDIIQNPQSRVTKLTLDEPTGELRHERFLVDGMSRRTIWLDIDTSTPQDAYRFIISGFGRWGYRDRYDVLAHPDGSHNTIHFLLDGQGSLLRKRDILGLGAPMVHRAVNYLLTHPETDKTLAESRALRAKVTAKVAELVGKQESGEKLSTEEKKAIKAAKGRGLPEGEWRLLDQVVPRVGSSADAN